MVATSQCCQMGLQLIHPDQARGAAAVGTAQFFDKQGGQRTSKRIEGETHERQCARGCLISDDQQVTSCWRYIQYISRRRKRNGFELSYFSPLESQSRSSMVQRRLLGRS
ncbi:hypothetical protein FGO68_gene16651 [Halteria grandinella]|uniref:Uncharacterized protein n=1 Tax=Halteria grandinella TaxID=5974 RepID=A0A8J8T312_HALGN|nr:hypothetical protein FGO68_gene16651 [Halteria grandinella]